MTPAGRLGFLVALALVGAVAACAPKAAVPEEAIEELPPWMSKEGGEKLRLTLIDQLLGSGNTMGALDLIRTMRSEGFDEPELDLQQGRALRLDGVTSEAERLLLQAQRRMPKDPRPAAELCVLYADLHRLDEAIDRCRRATEIDPHSAKAWNNLGFLLLASRDPDHALEAAEKALEIDSREPRYRNNLAMVQAALGRDDLAFRTFQSTMSRADAAYMVGQVLEQFSGPDSARPWYEKALQLQPDHPLASDALPKDPAAPQGLADPAQSTPTPPVAPAPAPEEAP